MPATPDSGTPKNPLPPSTEWSDPWRPYRLSWSSIFAGAFVAGALHLVFVMLGISFGLIPGPNGEHPAEIHAAAGIAMTFSAFVSLWLGGWLAGRTAGHGHGNVGGLHGVTVWGLVIVAAFLLRLHHGRLAGADTSGDIDSKARAIKASWTFLSLAVGAFAAGWGGRCGALRGVRLSGFS